MFFILGTDKVGEEDKVHRTAKADRTDPLGDPGSDQSP